MLETTLSNMERIYEEDATQYALPYEISSYANSLDAEKQIYQTPFEDEESYGPIYYEPPSNLQKIYEEFEGKGFHKLHHHEIRFVMSFLVLEGEALTNK